MSRIATTKSGRSSDVELPARSTTNTHEFLETCVLNGDHKTLKEHLVSHPVQQNDLDKCLLRGLRIVQRKERELSHVAQALTTLLQSGAKWNSVTLLDGQKTPYHIICESPGDHHELLELMIKSSQRTIIDRQDSRRLTALLCAMRNGNINCLKCLIANKADVNIGYMRYHITSRGVPPEEWSPLIESIKMLGAGQSSLPVNVCVNIFDVLLNSGVEVNKPLLVSTKPKYCISPIMVAITFGNVYSIKRLIRKGAQVDIVGKYKRYVWSSVAGLGDVELLKCMLNYGVDKDITDQKGVSILGYVVLSGNIEAVRYLLDLGVAIHTDTQGVRDEQCEQFKENRLRIKSSQQEEPDPCMKAIRYNMLEIVKLLEEYGSQIGKSFHALRRAVLSNSVDVARYLLDKYTYLLNIEYIKIELGHNGYEQGYTLLTELNSTHHPKSKLHRITKLLLDYGADPNTPICSTTSANAIMTAIGNSHLEVIGQYIRNGVKINVRSFDQSYKTVLPFEASVLYGYPNVAEMLLISGCSCGVFSLVGNHKDKNNLKPKMKKLMKEWKVQENNVIPLQQRCRSVILNHLSPRADVNIQKLPLPGCIIKFLSIPELDNIL